jgi:hypothetical protein
MARLIVGRFDDVDGVGRAVKALAAAGFAREEYGVFYSAPPGQHDLHPIGGDAHSDEGAKDAGKGAAAGAAVGGAAGLALGGIAAAAIPIAGVAALLAGLGIGAYTGSLMGAMSRTRDADETAATTAHPAELPGGPRVAVNVDRGGTEALAIEVLTGVGAQDIRRAEGTWRDREWQDFDPRVDETEEVG